MNQASVEAMIARQGLERVHLLPVRHFSPCSARMAAALIEQVRPAAVLIEGPADFNPRLHELGLEHDLPIAIFSFLRLEDGARSSAFYPFCEYSPEWVALRAGLSQGASVRFIDKPWHLLTWRDQEPNRYKERQAPPGDAIQALCERLGVESFDELWDVLFELNADLALEAYLRRAHLLCAQLRAQRPALPQDLEREAFMAEQILSALQEHPDQELVVVTGGFHSLALYERLLGKAHDDETDELAAPVAQGERGITLTPFTYERIDRMSGYAAGLHGPAYYEHLWHARTQGRPMDAQALLYQIVEALRAKGRLLSTADLTSVMLTAQSLAHMRGRQELWRFDLLDGLSAALIKEQTFAGYDHPLLHTAREVFCGSRRGALAAGVELPPLVRLTHELLAHQELTPNPRLAHVELDLQDEPSRAKSQTLHRLRLLEIAGFKLESEPDFAGLERLDEVIERWSIRWSPDFEGSLIECASYGVDLEEAATARLRERAQLDANGAHQAALIVLQAARMGLSHAVEELFEELAQHIRQDSDLFHLGAALRHLLYLYLFDDLFGGDKLPMVRQALAQSWRRAIWLMEGLGYQEQVNERELLNTLHAILLTYRRCRSEDFIDEQLFEELLERMAFDQGQMPMVQGACLGALHSLGQPQADDVMTLLRGFLEPEALGRFLIGLFSVARELAQRDPRILSTLDELIMASHEEEFLIYAPGLRLAFTSYTPAEKYALLRLLFPQEDAAQQRLALLARIDEQTIAQATALSLQLLERGARYGLRLSAAHNAPMPARSQPQRLAATKQSYQAQLMRTIEAYDPAQRLLRWRLIMGLGVESFFDQSMPANWAARERHLGFLYDREYDRGRRLRGSRQGGAGASALDVPDWINGVHELFPQQVIERLERDALERYGLEELVTRADLLERAEPNMTLLKAVLRTKHLMNEQVLQLAKRLVRQVIEELQQRLARDIETPFGGAIKRRPSQIKIAKNFDASRTIRENLKHFDPQRGQLIIKSPKFFSRIKRRVDQWQMIMVVDQSGSMTDSVIHAAVTASVFWGVRSLRTHLIVFDTEIVDLSEDCADPVETLMQVQLGGGTDIGKALRYAQTLIINPRQTIIALITDFYEGGPIQELYGVTKELTESGVKLLGLAALDATANPSYDKNTAQHMVNLGAEVAAMTPGELAQWVAQKVG